MAEPSALPLRSPAADGIARCPPARSLPCRAASGACRNTTDDEWRSGVFISYSLGWLRTEEHFALELTPEAAGALPPRVRMMCGFQLHRDLGFFDASVHAAAATKVKSTGLTQNSQVDQQFDWKSL